MGWSVVDAFPFYGFSLAKSMGVICCHGNKSSNPISPKTLCSLCPYPMMLYMKFDQNWATEFGDKLLRKCGGTMLAPTDHCHTNTSLELLAQVC